MSSKPHGGLVALALVLMIAASGCISQQRTVGGDRDGHGCLIAAGYSYDEDVGACTRNWELNADQKRAARIAVEHLGPRPGMTVVGVLAAKCPGCFTVIVQQDLDMVEVTLDNWAVASGTLSADDCVSIGGRTVDAAEVGSCNEAESNIGMVRGLSSPHFCCLSVTDFGGCVRAGFPVMESYPRQCRTPDGRTFTEVLNECTGVSGTVMPIAEAIAIAESGECAENGTLKDTYVCNSYTGTWWMDLDIKKEGCFPACVVDIESGTSEINWRCTGLLPP